MKVVEIMTREVRNCSPEDDLAKVGRTMGEVGCGVLPVATARGQVIGVLTDRDICLALADLDRPASQVLVREVMHGGAYACRPGDDVETALFEMARHKVRRLPVLGAEGRLEGILSLDDIAVHARPVAGEGFDGPFFVDVARTLRSICEHPGPRPH